MGSHYADLTGNRYGRLLVIKIAERRNGKIYWLCQCDCGNVSYVTTGRLTSEELSTKSCGCYSKEILKKQSEINGNGIKYDKGDSSSRIYSIWRGMVRRCHGNSSANKYYKDRGIVVCDEWKDFFNFKEWALRSGYSDDFTIDRIDNDGNYEPHNCRWTDWKTQCSNTRKNRYIEINGQTKTLTQWSDEYNIDSSTLSWRIDSGWPEEEWLNPSNQNYNHNKK